MSEEKEFTDCRVLESILKTLQKLHEKMLDDCRLCNLFCRLNGELSDIHQKDRELLEHAMWKLTDLCYMDEDEQRQADKMIDKIKQHLNSEEVK